MNSKKSSSNISRPLIADNIKRFWIGSALASIMYLIVCCVPIVINPDPTYFVKDVLNMSFLPVAMLITGIPLVATLIIYRYMQQPSSAAIVHSLPMSRKQIFHSQFLSGAILCLIPVVITGIVLCILSIGNPCYEQVFNPQEGLVQVANFTIIKTLTWMLMNTVLILAVYTICMFSAVLTGSTLIQLFISCLLLFIVPLILGITQLFGSIFLFGYISPEWSESVTKLTCPPATAVLEPGYITILVIAAWSILLYILSYIMYKKRAMEKTGETLIFRQSKPFAILIFSFLSMTGLAMFVYGMSSENDKFYLYAGGVLGALIGLAIIEMLIQRKVKVKGIWKSLILVACLAVAFFSIFIFDLTGYENRIPDADDVAWISIDNYNKIYFDKNVIEAPEDYVAQDKTVLTLAMALQENIVSEKEFLKDQSNYVYNTPEDDYKTADFSITYGLVNGKKITRSYSLPYKWLSGNSNYNNLYENIDYKSVVTPLLNSDPEDMDIADITVYSTYAGNEFGLERVTYTDKETTTRFIEAFKKDISEMSGEQYRAWVDYDEGNMLTLSIRTEDSSTVSEKSDKDYSGANNAEYEGKYNTSEYYISSENENVMNLIRELGIYDSVVLKADKVGYVSVVEYGETGEPNYAESTDEYTTAEDSVLGKESGYAHITDKAQIQEILDTAVPDMRFYGNLHYYELHLYPVHANEFNDDVFVSMYYTEDNVPDFVLNALRAV